ncbi:MAG TPA: AI-2E family transporter [Burkholderiaceae bacterium]|nr:AI-2E family transporter [Burkholderiaceae bacterium]
MTLPVPPSDPVTDDADPRAAAWTARRLALLAITGLVLYLCWLIARPFVASLTWATALAVIAWPLHKRFARWLRRPGMAAVLSCLVVLIVIGVPTTVLVPRIVEQAASAIDLIREWLASGRATQMLESQAWLRPIWAWAQDNLEAGALMQRAGDVLASVGKVAVQASLDGVLQLTLTFFLLFYFLRDRDDVLRSIGSLLPLSRVEGRTLLREVGDTLHATLVGKVLVSLLQGALGGAMFAVLGVPAALFWGVVMAVTALVPVLGTVVVWGPAAAWLVLEGELGKATVLVVWGTAVVGMADNLIYPMMVGNRVRMHTVPMLLSMIGGLFVFGMAGFFVGPVILATALGLLRIWSARSDGEATPPEAAGTQSRTTGGAAPPGFAPSATEPTRATTTAKRALAQAEEPVASGPSAPAAAPAAVAAPSTFVTGAAPGGPSATAPVAPVAPAPAAPPGGPSAPAPVAAPGAPMPAATPAAPTEAASRPSPDPAPVASSAPLR